MKLTATSKAVVRQVIGRLHVSASDLDVEKAMAAALSREAGNHPEHVFLLMREAHRVHLQNILIYRQVMDRRMARRSAKKATTTHYAILTKKES